MTFEGAGTRNSPIFIQDSEEEIIQELSYQQFYGSSSSTGKYDTTQSAQHSPHQSSSTAGKRKCPDDDESVADARSTTLTPSTSLENRISQHEGKKARKRRRRAEREALERNKSQNINWLDNPGSLPPATGPSQPAPPLQERVKTECNYPDFLEGVLRENQADMGFHDHVAPSSSTFDSDWVSSMVIAGEFPHCKKVKTSNNASPLPAPRPLPARPPSRPPPEVLPPIHIHPDFMVSTEAPIPTHLPQQPLPQTIGMKPDQDPKSKRGTFYITASTKEAGSGIRKNPYIPNRARTLVMEKLPKSHRTTDFVINWCLSVCGVLPHHLFVDPPSAKALIEFSSVELARKAWASPRLGNSFLGKKSHLLKGMPREDQIRVWWYRGVGLSVREIEEGEIEEDGVTENRAPQAPSSPRKESKKERKARSAKQRETKITKNNQQQKQKNRENSSALVPPTVQPAPSVNVSTPAQVQATSSQVHVPSTPEGPPAFPFDPIIGVGSLFPPTQPWPLPSTQSAPQVQPPTNSHFSTASSTTLNTGVGSSLAPGARGGHDDSASIASSGGRSSPECHWSRKMAAVTSSAKFVVEATTVGQADELADYSEVDMDFDNDLHRAAPVTTSRKSILSTAILPQQSSTKDNALALQPVIHSRPRFISGTLREKPRSKQPQPHPRSNFAHAPILATIYRPTVPPFILKNNPSHQPQQSSPLSPLTAGFAPISHVSSSSQHTPSSIQSKVFPSVPIPTGHASDTSLPPEPANIPKHAAPVQSNLDKQISEGNMERVATTPANSHPAPSPVSGFPASSAPGSGNSDSVGQAMEENLRQLVFASKRARACGVQPHSSQRHSSTSADVNMTLPVHTSGKVLSANDEPNRAQGTESNKVVNITESSLSAPLPATIPSTSNSTSLNESTTDTFSFEDLAITFITQTIEDVKANNDHPQPDPQTVDSSLGSTLTSVSEPPSSGAVVGFSTIPSGSTSLNTSAGGITPDKLLLAANSSNLSKSELSAKQSRLEKHVQESKLLMKRLSTAKTKREKDLLLRIMNEKMRLFEEETKACEKKTLGNPGSISIKKSTKGKMQTTTVLKFQQWPTIQSNPILVLSDDED